MYPPITSGRGAGEGAPFAWDTHTQVETHTYENTFAHTNAQTQTEKSDTYMLICQHTHTHTYNITHAYTHSHMQAISEGALWGGGAVTKSKVLIRSSGTLLTHPTPPRTDFL